MSRTRPYNVADRRGSLFAVGHLPVQHELVDGQPASLIRAGNMLYVAQDAAGKITAVHPDTLAIVDHLPIPGGPRGFAVVT